MKYYDGVLQRVRMLEHKNAIFYAKTDGTLYGCVKKLYIVVLIYALFNNIAYMLGLLIGYGAYFKDFMIDFLTVAVGTAMIMAGFVFLMKNFQLTAAALTVIPCVVHILFFRNQLIDEFTIDSVHPKFYWRHFAPLLIVIILILWLAGIALRERIKTKNMYTRVVENLYNLYKINVSQGDEISAEQWEDFLERYDPLNYKPQFTQTKEAEEEIEAESDT